MVTPLMMAIKKHRG